MLHNTFLSTVYNCFVAAEVCTHMKIKSKSFVLFFYSYVHSLMFGIVGYYLLCFFSFVGSLFNVDTSVTSSATDCYMATIVVASVYA